jgi:multidrug efflux pump subunit AcrB
MTTIALSLAVFALGVFGFKFIEKQFFPDSSRPELMVEMWTPEGTSFAANEALVKKFESVRRAQPELDSVTSMSAPAARASTCRWTRSSRSRTCRRWSCCRRTRTSASAEAQDRDVFKNDFPKCAAGETAAERAAGAVSGAVPGGRGRTSASCAAWPTRSRRSCAPTRTRSA